MTRCLIGAVLMSAVVGFTGYTTAKNSAEAEQQAFGELAANACLTLGPPKLPPENIDEFRKVEVMSELCKIGGDHLRGKR